MKHITEQNSEFTRCIDGRKSVAYVQKGQEGWEVAKRNEEAGAELGPQFLGGALLFVAALELLANMELPEAFDYAERALVESRFSPQIHIDDDHGHIDLSEMTDEEVVIFSLLRQPGCGFANYIWNENAPEVVQMAKQKGFRIQVLTGEHNEVGAVKNLASGDTFDSTSATKENESHFNIDLEDAKKVFVNLAEMIGAPAFINEAMDWTISTYEDVVIALNGVSSVEEIVTVDRATLTA